MMTFHAGDKLVVRGICDELIGRLQKKGLSTGHIFDTTNYTYTVTPFDTEGMKRELEEMCLQAGVTLLYHSYITDAICRNNRIISVEVSHKGGKESIEGLFYIDATGDCDLTYYTGGKYTQGRPKDGRTQPLSMNLKVCNVNVEKIREYIKANPAQFPCLVGKTETIDRAPRLSMGGYAELFQRAMKEKKVTFVREDILFFETNLKGELIINTTRILDVDPTDPYDLTRAEIAGRRQAWEVFHLLKNEVSGFENAVLEYTGPFVGIRSSRQIVGRHTLTAQELVSCAQFPDTIAHGGYPIDVHSPDGLDAGSGKDTLFKEGKMYNIPLSCMYGDLRNLITVGRCISVEFEAQAAIRVSPIAGAIGHAGGAAAAVCAADGRDIQDIDFGSVIKILREQNAFIVNSSSHTSTSAVSHRLSCGTGWE